MDNITEYNTLIQKLNPIGKYQLLMYGINLLLWAMAGFLKCIFDLNFNNFQCSYARSCFQFLGILAAGYIASYYNRRRALIILGIISCAGTCLCTVPSIAENIKILGTLGIAMSGISIYSMPYLSMCIICELTEHYLIKTILCLNIAFFCLFKMLAVLLSSIIIGSNSNEKTIDGQLAFFLLIPISIIQLICSLSIDESPRVLIETDFRKGDEVLKKIMSMNGLESEEILENVDDRFMMKRINIQKHRYLSFYKYGHFGMAQYSLFLIMMLLGIISQCPNFVLSGVRIMKSLEVQQFWISSFQIAGVTGISFFIRFGKRKTACMVMGGVLTLLSIVLYLISRGNMQKNIQIVGLTSTLAVALYIFLIYNAIEMYPHSVRTIGLGLTFSMYYLGGFLIKLYQYLQPSDSQILQLFLLGSILLFMHSFGLMETIGKGFSYQLKQVQENQQFEQP